MRFWSAIRRQSYGAVSSGSRLGFLRRSLLGALLAAGAMLAVPALSYGKELKPVTIVHANPVMVQGSNMGYIPLAMNYWREMGYDVRLVPGRDPSTTIQQLIGGTADFAMINTSPVISAHMRTGGDVRSLSISSYMSWRVFTLKSGPASFANLKGKKIGIPSPVFGATVHLNDALRKSGIDPEADVKFVVAGVGGQALEALRSGRIDALVTFRVQAHVLEAQGVELNVLYDDEWLQFPDYGLATKKSTADRDPKMVEDIARGFAMGLVFEQANPECSARIFNKLYVRDLTEETEKFNLFAAQRSKEERLNDFKKAGGKYWGNIDMAGLGKVQDFLLRNKVIDQTVPVEELMVDPGIVPRANQFDADKVRQDAIDCFGF